MKIISLFLLLCVVSNSFAVALPEYYYYSSQNISAIDAGSSQRNFLLSGSARLLGFESNTILFAKPRYYLSDGKSTAIWLNKGAAAEATMRDYQAYGKSQTSAVSRQFGYNGEYQDPSTGLIDLRARNYNPVSQRFNTIDSTVVWNKYNFADANPISHIDPSGHSSESDRFFSQVGHFFKHYWPNVLMIAAGAFFVGSGIRENRSIESGFIELDPDVQSHVLTRNKHKLGIFGENLETEYVRSNASFLYERGLYQYFHLDHNRLFNDARVYKLGLGAGLVSAGGLFAKTHNHILDSDHPWLGISALFLAMGSIAFGVALAFKYRHLRFYAGTSEDFVLEGFRQKIASTLEIDPDQITQGPREYGGGFNIFVNEGLS